VWLAIVAIALAPSPSRAQTTPVAPGDDKAKAADPKKPAEKEEKDDDTPTTEIFTDPNAKKALSVISPLIYSGVPILVKPNNPPDDRNKVQSMAGRAINIDPDFLKRYVEFFAVELTKRDYLNALLNPPEKMKPNALEVRGLERAVDALTKPIIDARANQNTQFLDLYTKLLFDSSLTKILDNNYLTRIDAMIVLGMAGSSTPQALDVYIKELRKPDQVIWVKLWAARGLTNAAQGGKVDLEAQKANQAVEALVGFLDTEKLPWPAQIRALEALGAIRVAAVNTPRGKIDAASPLMKVLADPDAKLEVRAWAAWALGTLKVPQGTTYNYNLVGYEIGKLAIDLGQQIVEEYDDHANEFEKEKIQAEHLTSILLFQVYPALIGEDGIRGSGLMNSSVNSKDVNTKPFLAKLDELTKGICRESYELLRAPTGGLKGKRNDLDAKVAAMKQLLEQSPPKDRHLVPGGPEFGPAVSEAVAGARQP
jgi:hypothetical protein